MKVGHLTLKQQITDESLGSGVIEKLSLFLLTDQSQVCYCLVDDDRNKIIGFGDYHHHGFTQVSEALEEVLKTDEIVNGQTFRRIVSGIFQTPALLIPEALFEEQSTESYLHLALAERTESRPASDQLRLSDTRVVYSLEESLLQSLTSSIQNPQVFHGLSGWSDYQLMQYKHEKSSVLAVNVRRENLDILAIHSGNLLFCNSFSYESPEDFIYYLLFVMEQLGLNPDLVPVYFSGEIQANSSSYMVSRKYIRHSGFGERPETSSYSYALGKLPAHQYQSLFTLCPCAL